MKIKLFESLSKKMLKVSYGNFNILEEHRTATIAFDKGVKTQVRSPDLTPPIVSYMNLTILAFLLEVINFVLENGVKHVLRLLHSATVNTKYEKSHINKSTKRSLQVKGTIIVQAALIDAKI